MIKKSLISELSWTTASVCYTCYGLFAKHHIVPQLVYKRSDQLTDKMSDFDKGFDILRDIKPYSFEQLAKKFTDSINCQELAAASAYVDPDSHRATDTGR